jgi:hypothetical protein
MNILTFKDIPPGGRVYAWSCFLSFRPVSHPWRAPGKPGGSKPFGTYRADFFNQQTNNNMETTFMDAIVKALIVYGVAAVIGILVALLISGLSRALRAFLKDN